jgi:hypothetical protein
MSFLFQCPNKDCKKVTELVLDPQTNLAHCSDCDCEISEVTSFVKNSLRGIKKFRDSKKRAASFAMACKNCHKKMTPLLIKNNLHCPECRNMHEVSPHFKNVFILNLKQNEH